MDWYRQHQHKVEALIWVLLTIPAFIWWKESLFYIILVSHYANYKTAISADEGRKARKAAESPSETPS